MHCNESKRTAESRGVRDLASDFCLHTSVHGVSHIVLSYHVAKKIGWTVILGGILAGSSFHLAALISSYLEYNYYTSITHDAGKPLKVNCFVPFVDILELLDSGLNAHTLF